jgi:hypothetical protein
MSDNNSQFETLSHKDPILVDSDCLDIALAKKEAEREELQKQVESFLSSGGTINYIEPNVLADPPKKPTSNYGSQPI